jgi:hypothetical protein
MPASMQNGDILLDKRPIPNYWPRELRTLLLRCLAILPQDRPPLAKVVARLAFMLQREKALAKAAANLHANGQQRFPLPSRKNNYRSKQVRGLLLGSAVRPAPPIAPTFLQDCDAHTHTHTHTQIYAENTHTQTHTRTHEPERAQAHTHTQREVKVDTGRRTSPSRCPSSCIYFVFALSTCPKFVWRQVPYGLWPCLSDIPHVVR